MVYIRGYPVDHDTWRDTYGCAGWGYADLLPYFRKAEDQQRGESAYHGTGGPLRVEHPPYRHVLSRAWFGLGAGLWPALNDDFNGVEQDGVGFYQLTQRGGRRWSTAQEDLLPFDPPFGRCCSTRPPDNLRETPGASVAGDGTATRRQRREKVRAG
jgi:choline dehydrogenase